MKFTTHFLKLKAFTSFTTINACSEWSKIELSFWILTRDFLYSFWLFCKLRSGISTLICLFRGNFPKLVHFITTTITTTHRFSFYIVIYMSCPLQFCEIKQWKYIYIWWFVVCQHQKYIDQSIGFRKRSKCSVQREEWCGKINFNQVFMILAIYTCCTMYACMYMYENMKPFINFEASTTIDMLVKLICSNWIIYIEIGIRWVTILYD